MSLNSKLGFAFAGVIIGLQVSMVAAQQPRNVVLFIADGLRALAVRPETAPAMAAVRDQGVNFVNSHSLFPSFTMANAAGMATEHHCSFRQAESLSSRSS